ncbi:copper resistance protein B [Sphingomonas sp.]|jgi:copper resistance protein B|uniref:copper resistance protein B n=1 Tax=Sphingomonas sp. TaxID=28214 RepID=UPI002ED93404
MKRLLLLAAASTIICAAPAAGQSMDHSDMPGMTPPKPTPTPASKPAEDQHAGHAAQPNAKPAAAEPADPHAGHDMSAMPEAGPATPQASGDPGLGGTALPPGNAPAPVPVEANYADSIWGRDAMIGSRAAVMREHGGGTFSQIIFNIAEYQAGKRADGFRWEGEGWFGGDINRLVVKTEGEATFGEGVESAEVQGLYSRAIDPYFNVQVGVRHDFEPGRPATYATVGIEGLAPYWFEVEGALFLSTRGDLLARAEGYYDQRITQRVILQPRVEFNLSAQDVPASRIGAGLVDVELGLRLRYEISREFAPYVGVAYEAKTGRTANFSRVAGEDPTSANFVVGVRFWF